MSEIVQIMDPSSLMESISGREAIRVQILLLTFIFKRSLNQIIISTDSIQTV